MAIARPPIIAALGVTQIIGYGSIYYAFAILSPYVAAEFAVGQPVLFAILSAGLFLGGLAAPVLGRMLDRMGAARVMAGGSLMMAGLLAVLAMAPNIYVFGATVLVIELLGFAVLYDAAFALLAQKRPHDTRIAITRLTLIAGFASTLFWPLTGWLVDAVGWRMTQGIFALLHLVCAGVHLWLVQVPSAAAAVADGAQTPTQSPRAAMTPATARRAFILLGAGFALTGMAIAALGVHMVPILQAKGLGDLAFVVAMAMGPAQVLIRLVDAVLWRGVHPLAVAIIAALAIPCAIVFLILPAPAPAFALPLALGFALCLGVGGGLSSIVRGAVPVALFGTDALGQRLGNLALIRSALGAVAPFVYSWVASTYAHDTALWLFLAAALVGALAVVILYADLRRARVI